MPPESIEVLDSFMIKPLTDDRADDRTGPSLGSDPMKLLEAFEILKRPVFVAGSAREISLSCGFTPLHLKTFLEAHLRTHFPTKRIEIQTGLYGDLAGNLERLERAGGSETCVVVEWGDLDPRLGIRSLGNWRSADIPEVVESARRQSERLIYLIRRTAELAPVYVTSPTLPLPPIFVTRAAQAHKDECKLREIAGSFSAALSASRQVKVISSQRLDELSPLDRRFDPKAEMSSGFPYRLEHTSILAGLFATLIDDVPPKKGLITDLDDTLWAGILGEVGVAGVSWDTASGAHMHGLYQRFLGSLSSAGVLLAVASKNDRALAEKALARRDILLSREHVFPLQVNWDRKPESVQRILKAWNIGSDDVVFVDDSPMEVAEVHAAFPQMECIAFPKHDSSAVWRLLRTLRDRFGKSEVSAEDEIRLDSIHSSAAFRSSVDTPDFDTDTFLRNAHATILFSLKPDTQDNRAFELINKTNQFNLNGRRWSHSDWLSSLQDSNAFLLTAAYEDRYGPLGKIAVVMGKHEGSKLRVASWVMSCRAFSRRIEHQCLKYLFEKMGVEEIVFDYVATPRNGPIQNFFAELLQGPPPENLSLEKAAFSVKAPPLFHRVNEVGNV
jgi:FkbH-like protein